MLVYQRVYTIYNHQVLVFRTTLGKGNAKKPINNQDGTFVGVSSYGAGERI